MQHHTTAREHAPSQRRSAPVIDAGLGAFFFYVPLGNFSRMGRRRRRSCTRRTSAKKGRGNRGGKQHVVLLNTENAGRSDARGGGTELAGSECHSIHGVWGPEAWGDEGVARCGAGAGRWTATSCSRTAR
jgi:hypothetical protein